MFLFCENHTRERNRARRKVADLLFSASLQLVRARPKGLADLEPESLLHVMAYCHPAALVASRAAAKLLLDAASADSIWIKHLQRVGQVPLDRVRHMDTFANAQRVRTHIAAVDDPVLERALRLLSQNRTTSLNLAGKGVGNRGAILLATALKVNSSAREIDLSDNDISDSGAMALADALAVKATKRHIFRFDGTEPVHPLQVHLVTKLYLFDNEISSTGISSLKEAQRVNADLRVYIGELFSDD